MGRAVSLGLWASVRGSYSLPWAMGSCRRLSLRRDSFSFVSCLLTGLSCLRFTLFLSVPSLEGRPPGSKKTRGSPVQGMKAQPRPQQP